MTKNELVSAATEIYGDRYDYSLVKDKDVRNNVNIPVKCIRHGLFYVSPYQLVHGLFGCFECYKEREWEKKEDEG